jgi:hypothetical protein
MNKNHQLTKGHKLGGHYEVVEVLGEDEYEILYLVKDLHLGENFFVLKELFLSAYATRNEEKSVEVMAKSKQFFEQTKEDVKKEVKSFIAEKSSVTPRLYGYFEENNTVYTIMEFVESAKDSSYLESKNQENKTVVSPIAEEKSKGSYWFLKLLILGALVMAGLMYYSYDMIQKDKERAKNKPINVTVTTEPMPHPTLKEKKEEPKEENLSTVQVVEDEKESLEGAAYIEEEEQAIEKEEDFSNIPKEEIYIDSEVESVEEVPSSETSFSLGTKIN